MLSVLTFSSCGDKEKNNQCATYQADVKACQTTYDNCIKGPTGAYLTAVNAFQNAIITCEDNFIAAKAVCKAMKPGAAQNACTIAATKANTTCVANANAALTQAFMTYTAGIAKCQADKDTCMKKVRAAHKECLDSTE